MFECRVTNVSKLYGAYDSIGINVVSFGEFLSPSNPKKCSANSTRDFFGEKKKLQSHISTEKKTEIAIFR